MLWPAPLSTVSWYVVVTEGLTTIEFPLAIDPTMWSMVAFAPEYVAVSVVGLPSLIVVAPAEKEEMDEGATVVVVVGGTVVVTAGTVVVVEVVVLVDSVAICTGVVVTGPSDAAGCRPGVVDVVEGRVVVGAAVVTVTDTGVGTRTDVFRNPAGHVFVVLQRTCRVAGLTQAGSTPLRARVATGVVREGHDPFRANFSDLFAVMHMVSVETDVHTNRDSDLPHLFAPDVVMISPARETQAFVITLPASTRPVPGAPVKPSIARAQSNAARVTMRRAGTGDAVDRRTMPRH